MQLNSTPAENNSLSVKIATLIAKRIWIILMASALGHLGMWHWFLDLFAHFRWQYLMASALCLAAAIYVKNVRLIALGALSLLWNFALIAQYPLAKSIVASIPTKPLKVLFANCAMSNRGNSLIALIRAESPDVIGVAELSDEFSMRLKAEFRASYTVQALFPEQSWQGIGVLVKNGSLPNVSADLVDIAQLEFPTARLRWQGGELLIVHPIPPVTSDAAASRDAYFAALSNYATLQLRAKAVIIAGDFNASVWSAPYQQMQISGAWVDSTVGFWPTPTWHGPNALFAPFTIPIDQLLTRGPAVVADRRVVANPDSDHSILIVTLMLAP